MTKFESLLKRSHLAGEYPEDINEARHQLHLSGDFSTKNLGPTPITAGDTTGLYHLILGDGQNAFVANGNVFCYVHIRKLLH